MKSCLNGSLTLILNAQNWMKSPFITYVEFFLNLSAWKEGCLLFVKH